MMKSCVLFSLWSIKISFLRPPCLCECNRRGVKHFLWLQKSPDQNKFTQTLCQVFVFSFFSTDAALPHVSLCSTVGVAIVFQKS